MTYSEHATRARKLSAREAAEELRQLGQDHRFAGIVRFLLEQERTWSEIVSLQEIAGSHGKLAHCAGSLHALKRLQEQLSLAIRGRRTSEPTLGDGPPES